MSVESANNLVLGGTEWIWEEDEEIRSQMKDIAYKIVATQVESESEHVIVFGYIYVPEDWDDKKIRAAKFRNRIDGTRVFH